MPAPSHPTSGSAADFFEDVTGLRPYGYQRRLAEQSGWPDLLDVPTGLGKTAAIVVSWLWKRLVDDPDTGRRLVYCLPMRTLVEQTHESSLRWCQAAAPLFAERGLPGPSASVLMGGETEAEWDVHPGRPQVIVGTQDMLLSRALGRGYGMSRYRWPVHFGLLNSDCLWVFDETQLMGVGVETSAQLAALRRALGTLGPSRSLWMSATLGREQLATVDHPEPAGGWAVHGLSDEERAREEAVRVRTLARKRLVRAGDIELGGEPDEAWYRRVAQRVATAAIERGGLTLVVVNRVERAREIFRAVEAALSGSAVPAALLHSRFRPPDREKHRALLDAEGDRVVVATQVVEAGVDVSARTLFTELAPWPSLVQRFGRCNRYGEAEGQGIAAEIHWLPLGAQDGDEGFALPYDAGALALAAGLLGELESQGGDAGPESLARIPYRAPPVVRPVLRRRDLLDLFDTSPDLLGWDIDISRFVRDAGEPDVQFFWRRFDLVSGRPPAELARTGRGELCRVSVGAARAFLMELDKLHRRGRTAGRDAEARTRLLQAWRWDPLEDRWERVQPRSVRPGETLLLHESAEGYDPVLGWTGRTTGKGTVPELATGVGTRDSTTGDPQTDVGQWVLLGDHLAHVERMTRTIAAESGLEDRLTAVLATAARWHDVGKAHEQFQRRLLDPLEDRPDHPNPGPGLWAKSDHRFPAKRVRRQFRHELASALAWLTHHAEDDDAGQPDLVAFLIAAHHGKVRLALRSVPGEEEPGVPGALYARGVWDGDVLPALELPGGESLPPTPCDLSPMRLGRGSWTERVLALRDDPALGPFRLACLEGLIRAADERASAAEKAGGTGEVADA